MPGNPIEYVRSGFLKPILELEGLTDVSYNGKEIYYVTNDRGRQKSEVKLTPEEAGNFLRQVANLTERQFSFTEPILDVSFGNYRLNAVFRSLARDHNEKTYSFSIRLERECAIKRGDKSFFPGNSEEILLDMLSKGESIVIGGPTSSGKTELEKYLISQMRPNTRVIAIDNVEELSFVRGNGIDLTHWLVNDTVPKASFPSLVKNALRNNPDYVVVAEARGEEMMDALVSSMSGHPIITSVHARSIEALPSRMARLAMMSSPRLDRDSLVEDIAEHIRGYVYLKKRVDEEGKIVRSIESIGTLDPSTKQLRLLYKEETNA